MERSIFCHFGTELRVVFIKFVSVCLIETMYTNSGSI